MIKLIIISIILFIYKFDIFKAKKEVFQKIKSLLIKDKSIPSLFIHIPKCGGSSFVGLLKESNNLSKSEKETPSHKINTVGHVKIKHVDFKSRERKFKAYDIFNPIHYENYSNYKIFLLVRNPIDRLFSEYNFQYHILDGKNNSPNAAIIAQLKRKPSSFDEYIRNREVQDYQCKFLIGRKLADPNPIRQKEFDTIIKTIDELDFHCGITESFSSFLNLFQYETNSKLKSKVLKRKQTPSHLKLQISDKTKQLINKSNKYDVLLYEHVSNLIKNKKFENLNKDFIIESKDKFIV